MGASSIQFYSIGSFPLSVGGLTSSVSGAHFATIGALLSVVSSRSYAKTAQDLAAQMGRVLDPNFDSQNIGATTDKYKVSGATLLVRTKHTIYCT